MASLRLDVFHTGLQLNMPELVFTRDKSVHDLKENLYRRTGTKPEDMELWLVDALDRRREILNDDARTLGFVVPPEAEGAGWKLHIVDTDETSISATPDLLQGDVPKYEAPHGRKDFAEFRRAKRGEKQSGSPAPTSKTGLKEAAEFEEDERVVTLKDGLKGTVRYIGKCATAAPGFFVGVELDEPKDELLDQNLEGFAISFHDILDQELDLDRVFASNVTAILAETFAGPSNELTYEMYQNAYSGAPYMRYSTSERSKFYQFFKDGKYKYSGDHEHIRSAFIVCVVPPAWVSEATLDRVELVEGIELHVEIEETDFELRVWKSLVYRLVFQYGSVIGTLMNIVESAFGLRIYYLFCSMEEIRKAHTLPVLCLTLNLMSTTTIGLVMLLDGWGSTGFLTEETQSVFVTFTMSTTLGTVILIGVHWIPFFMKEASGFAHDIANLVHASNFNNPENLSFLQRTTYHMEGASFFLIFAVPCTTLLAFAPIRTKVGLWIWLWEFMFVVRIGVAHNVSCVSYLNRTGRKRRGNKISPSTSPPT
ncbi:Tubulin-folding cofactor B [Hondaea fermentalgiana]|uniref:Tubulin-folding cofactor B n=1 Tax=Hondaea fermentalgiana TaxID=2315210 RepID=A0A2R5GS96_9STRA|nr:Tubulin-folding cofactor B [Hondaea fermentalgiana]|eukprot:GBG31231.1 Tubulin-folding cofactor B [Hondaea fermentalgiana]